MARERLYYTILWVIAVVAISIPWATLDGDIYVGWNFLDPFSFPYLVGLILGLIPLITKIKAFTFSLTAGFLMIIGVFGGFLAMGTLEVIAEVGESAGIPATVIYSPGIGFAFIWSVIYTVIAPILTRQIGE